MISFYNNELFNPHWGEQLVFRPGNVLAISMVFQGLAQEDAEAIWRPFFDWLADSSHDFRIAEQLRILAVPARHFWNPNVLERIPGVVIADDRRGAPATNVFWAGDQGEAGQFLHGYQSAWLPATLLAPSRQHELDDALFDATRNWPVSLHVNKGLAGAPPDAVAAADTAMNPAVQDAFALAISGAQGPPAYPDISGREPDVSAARRHAAAVDRTMSEIRKLVPLVGSYVAESDFFDEAWQESFWGQNYAKLLAVKDKYDPDRLFFVHHGVGSERWSVDGFTRRE